jgi:voltage-gated potassium channel
MRRILRQNALMIFLWAIVLNIGFGLLFYYVEKDAQELTIADALWWSMVTMTTVGYGDFFAKTFAGRFIISYPCMILGIGLIGYLVGTVANAFLDFSARKRGGLMQVHEKGHIVLCNYPGEVKVRRVITELQSVDEYRHVRFVLITEKLEELPESLRKMDVVFVKGTPTQVEVLLRADITRSAGVIVLARDSNAIESDERTYTVASVIKQIEREKGTSIKVVTELASENSIPIMKQLNVSGITSEDGVPSCLIAQEFVNPGINKVFAEIITSRMGSEFYIISSDVAGKTMRDVWQAALDHDRSLQILGIRRGGKNMLNPAKDTVVEKGDRLIVLAINSEDATLFEKELKKMA